MMANTLSAPLIIILLALSHAFVAVAMATTSNQETAPSPSPLNQKKRGLHGSEAATVAASHGSGSAPLLAPEGSTEKEAPTEQEEDLELKRAHHHRSTMDKSVAGGGVILGGLATVFLVAVFCYVRATRRSKRDPESLSPV